LGEALQIGQAQGLQLLLQEPDAAQPVEGHSGGLVNRLPGRVIK
jgi:hypothetical protein